MAALTVLPARPRRKGVRLCDNVHMVESAGVDSSVLIRVSGYTEDIVDYQVWHCNTCY